MAKYHSKRPKSTNAGPPHRRSETHKKTGRKPAGDKATPTMALKAKDSYLLYGRNSVFAALNNPRREHLRLLATERAMEAQNIKPQDLKCPLELLENTDAIRQLVPEGAPHQGLFLEVRPLPGLPIEDLIPIERQKNIILMLDQVTDPQNVGACLRSAAAFGARAVVTPDRNSPPESGALARASAGGLEVTPWLRCANLVQALESLKDMGYWHIGLDGHTETSIRQTDLGDNIVVVMGSEGKGLRPLVRKHCDVIAKIPTTGMVESLNVSNAAAIALFALSD